MKRRTIFALPAALYAAPAIDLAAIDRKRILESANRYLGEKPITVTASSSPRCARRQTRFLQRRRLLVARSAESRRPLYPARWDDKPGQFRRTPEGADAALGASPGIDGGLQNHEAAEIRGPRGAPPPCLVHRRAEAHEPESALHAGHPRAVHRSRHRSHRHAALGGSCPFDPGLRNMSNG